MAAPPTGLPLAVDPTTPPDMARKATGEEIEVRTETCMSLVAKGLRKGEIKRAMAKAFGISHKQAERYLGRAREAMIQRLNRSKDELRAGSLAFYESVLASKSATTRDRIMAQKRIDQLLGLEAPRRLEHTGADGGPIQNEVREVRNSMRTIMSDPEAMALADRLADKAEAAQEPEESERDDDAAS